MENNLTLAKQMEQSSEPPTFRRQTIFELEEMLSIVKPESSGKKKTSASARMSAELARIENSSQNFQSALQSLRLKDGADEFMAEFVRLIDVAEQNENQNQIDLLFDMVRVKHQIERIGKAAELDVIEDNLPRPRKLADTKDILRRAHQCANDLSFIINRDDGTLELAAIVALSEYRCDFELDVLSQQLVALGASIEKMLSKLPSQGRERAYHDLAFKVADICNESQIKISNSPKSVFYRIFSLVLMEIGHSGDASASLKLLMEKKKDKIEAREFALQYVANNCHKYGIKPGEYANPENAKKCAQMLADFAKDG